MARLTAEVRGARDGYLVFREMMGGLAVSPGELIDDLMVSSVLGYHQNAIV